MATKIEKFPLGDIRSIDSYELPNGTDSCSTLKKSPLQELRKIKDRSQVRELTLEAKDFSAKVVKVVLNTFQSFITSLTLDGSWPDVELKCFAPYLHNITSLHLVNVTFNDEAFDEVFTSKYDHSLFEDTLDSYQETSLTSEKSQLTDEDEFEWGSAPFTPPERRHPPLECSLMTFEELLLIDPFCNPRREGIDEPEPGSIFYVEKSKAVPTRSNKSNALCPLLRDFTIENAPNLTRDFLLKLLFIKDQLNSLTFKNCPSLPPKEEIQNLFPKTQVVVD